MKSSCFTGESRSGKRIDTEKKLISLQGFYTESKAQAGVLGEKV